MLEPMKASTLLTAARLCSETCYFSGVCLPLLCFILMMFVETTLIQLVKTKVQGKRTILWWLMLHVEERASWHLCFSWPPNIFESHKSAYPAFEYYILLPNSERQQRGQTTPVCITMDVSSLGCCLFPALHSPSLFRICSEQRDKNALMLVLTSMLYLSSGMSASAAILNRQQQKVL